MAESQSSARLRRLQKQRERANERQFRSLAVAAAADAVAAAADAATTAVAPTAAPDDGRGTGGRTSPATAMVGRGAPAAEPDLSSSVARLAAAAKIGTMTASGGGAAPRWTSPSPPPPIAPPDSTAVTNSIAGSVRPSRCDLSSVQPGRSSWRVAPPSPPSMSKTSEVSAEDGGCNKNKSVDAGEDSWFQYTNGTMQGGSVASNAASRSLNLSRRIRASRIVSEKPTTMGALAYALDCNNDHKDHGLSQQATEEQDQSSQEPNIRRDDEMTEDKFSARGGIGTRSVKSNDSTLVRDLFSARGGSETRLVKSNDSMLVRDSDTLPAHRSNRPGSKISLSGFQSQRPDSRGSNDATTIVTNPTRDSTIFSSHRSVSTQKAKSEATPDDLINRSNTRKETPPLGKLHQNKFKNIPPANNSYENNYSIHSSDTKPASTFKKDSNIGQASTWARKTSGQYTAPSTIDVSSKVTGVSNNSIIVLKQHHTRQTKQKLLIKPVDKVSSVVELLPSEDININKGKRFISIRHGGTPVWIHASLLSGNEALLSSGWDWIRGYLHASSGESDDSVAVTIDDPDSSTDLNGHTCAVPKRYNDGAHILMDNAWWSTLPVPAPSPSPISISQPLDAAPANGGTSGMPPGDLVEMTHLHEPAIVHALRTRYRKDIIYTNTGAILLALNPFKYLDHLFTRDMMELYWSDCVDGDGANGRRGRGEEEGSGATQPPPHVYAVAERAYSSMLRSFKKRDNDDGMMANGDLSLCNQSILVSGESGAGKTVTTKIIMRYISILSQRHRTQNAVRGGPGVETQVLQSNPILESFGNARTVRNDNSSRFGKFIEMSFQAQKKNQSSGERGSLLGATIDFYLLEKVRLVSVNPGERNYHIFYEILSPHGMSIKDKKRYMLTSDFGKGRIPLTVKDFSMTSISGTFNRRDGVDDSDTYGELRTALNTVGFSIEEQDGMFSLVAALLHASNLQFVNDGNDDCLVCEKDGTSEALSILLGVSEDSLKMSLTASIIEARGEVLTKRLSSVQAQKALEATVKATYGALFTYIVTRINKSIEVQGVRGANDWINEVGTVGVLDIFGFESFDTNSFEQICINYANEALQQQFNRFVFKAEQAEYEHEGIEWSNIEFPDNQEALELIEAKRLGIFSVLDEQCRLPRRTDQTFANAVYDACENNPFFAATQMQKSKGRFSIVHYAGEVEYNSDSFIVKNKDELPKNASHLLSSSSVPLITRLSFIINDNDSTPKVSPGDNDRASVKRSSRTVSGQFSSQLKALRSRIATTEPHYIRCLKPNDQLMANHFDESLIAHQLNCAGVIPAMKIARAGFAMRYPHSAFIQRYRPIVCKELRRRPQTLLGHQSICRFLLSLVSTRLEYELKQRTKNEDIADLLSWGIQIGKSKVFLRATAFEALEKLRNSTLNDAATILQARTRSFLCQNTFYLILGSVLTLQCATRKFIASLYVRRLRFHERSITIQKQWRSYCAWIEYQNILFIATWCQRFWRGRQVRARSISIEPDRLGMELSHMKQQLEQVLETRYNRNTMQATDSWITAKTTTSQEETIHMLSQEIAKKDHELRVLRQMVESLRGSGCSEMSSLPCMVTVDEKLPLIRPIHFSPTDLSSSQSKSIGFHPNSFCLLDSEVEDIPQMEYSQTSLPGSSMDNTDEFGNIQLNKTPESSFIRSFQSEELPFHQAVLDDDKEILLGEIQNTSCIELGINSADSKGR